MVAAALALPAVTSLGAAAGPRPTLDDGLLIATGVEARRVNGGAHGHPRVVTMRAIGDAKRLPRARSGNRFPVVIRGSGFSGCEIASSLRSMAREVTIVGRSGTPKRNPIWLVVRLPGMGGTRFSSPRA